MKLTASNDHERRKLKSGAFHQNTGVHTDIGRQLRVRFSDLAVFILKLHAWGPGGFSELETVWII